MNGCGFLHAFYCLLHVIYREEQVWHNNQSYEGGEQDAISQRQGHGDEKPCLFGCFKNHGRQSAEGGECWQEHWPEPLYSRGVNGRVSGDAFLSLPPVGEIDHYQ